MDVWSWVALTVSALALAVAVRQTNYTRAANHLPLAIDFVNQFHKVEFQEDYDEVQRQLRAADASAGLSGLGDDTRVKAIRIVSLFQALAFLVVYEIMEEELVLAAIGPTIRRSWRLLAPFIEAERRQPEPLGYYRFFEHLAKREAAFSIDRVYAKRKLQNFQVG